jgi:anti-sigma regulatory factor (Ser/Thr protein kinase)
MTVAMDVRIPSGPEAPRTARQALGGLAPSLPPGTMEDLRLLVSELITNSVRHSGIEDRSWIGLSVQVLPRALRVEVVDAGPGFEPKPITPSLYRSSGWGLYLVGQISSRWGVIQDGGTRVWFELDMEA